MASCQTLDEGATMREVTLNLAHQRGLVVAVVDGKLTGVFSAGDLSRLAERETEFLTKPLRSVMTRTPKTAGPDDLAASAVGTMEKYGIMALPVIEADGRVLGVVHLHDLMRAGAV
jgi:arabinose-5-phosphate isomerase